MTIKLSAFQIKSLLMPKQKPVQPIDKPVPLSAESQQQVSGAGRSYTPTKRW